jgi:hypothetical protein
VKKISMFEILRFDISERNSAKRFWGEMGCNLRGCKSNEGRVGYCMTQLCKGDDCC